MATGPSTEHWLLNQVENHACRTAVLVANLSRRLGATLLLLTRCLEGYSLQSSFGLPHIHASDQITDDDHTYSSRYVQPERAKEYATSRFRSIFVVCRRSLKAVDFPVLKVTPRKTRCIPSSPFAAGWAYQQMYSYLALRYLICCVNHKCLRIAKLSKQ